MEAAQCPEREENAGECTGNNRYGDEKSAQISRARIGRVRPQGQCKSSDVRGPRFTRRTTSDVPTDKKREFFHHTAST